MKKFFNFKSFVVSLAMIIFATSASVVIVFMEFDKYALEEEKIVYAGAGDAFTGFAWNEKYGWISFNCTNDTSCGDVDYGVNINASGNLSGYAWSSNLGWISFVSNNTPDNSVVTNNCDVSCDPTSNCTACLKTADLKLYGWAKILSLGEDGWIRFDDHNGGAAPNYGVSLPGGLSGGTENLSGWAYNEGAGDTGVGWISFNAENCDIDDNGFVDVSCGGNNTSDILHVYAVSMDTTVLNQAPYIDNLNAPNIADPDTYYCNNSVLSNWLSWDFNDDDSGDTEFAYQIIVDDDNNIADPLFDTGICNIGNIGTNDCLIGLGVDYYNLYSSSMSLNYGDTYYWWVQVWDNSDAPSGFEFSGDFSVNFTVPNNEYPDSYFDWSPRNFSADEQVKFIDDSNYYIGDTSQSCEQGQCSYSWEFSNLGTEIGDFNSSASTTQSFSDTGNWSATSTVTDSNGYACATTTQATVNLKLPTWIEGR